MANTLPRLIAFYLPQFHPIAENDQWWGKGFTEWTNVARAKPLFEGHYQPRQPADLGFYDLRVPEIMQQQAELAQHYGIHGFCYYYYWFAGKRLLEKPIDRMLASGQPNFPFCLCWANENWTRRWNGGEQDMLIKQEYGPDFAQRIIRDMMPFLKDRRYIRVNNKPVLLVYRVDILPDCAAMTRVWREEAAAAGLAGLYLIRVESFIALDPRPLGFDAACEFPPHLLNASCNFRPCSLNRATHRTEYPTLTGLDAKFAGAIFDYNKVANHYGHKPPPDYKRFKGLLPSWDNTARRQLAPYILLNSTPELYQAWLEVCLIETDRRFQGEERLVFINAWNEWAEGCYLEPDQAFGHRYLEATREALENVSNNKLKHRQNPLDSGMALLQAGQLEDANQAFTKARKQQPDNPQIRYHLGLIALLQNRKDDANRLFDQAVRFSADRANAQASIGQRCLQAGELTLAEQYLTAAISTQPTLIGAYGLLATVWQQQQRHAEALKVLQPVVKYDTRLLGTLVQLTAQLGDLEAEYAACTAAAAYPDSHSRAILLMSWKDDVQITELRKQTIQFAKQHCRSTTAEAPLVAGRRTRLRVGFVISQLDRDDTRYRLEPLLHRLDPKGFETIVFTNGASNNATAQRCHLIIDHWVSIADLEAHAVHQLIRDWHTDILINVEGLSDLSSLEPFLHRCAPLQINWSYPLHTTGLATMDRLIIEPFQDETVDEHRFYTERPLPLNVPQAFAFPCLTSVAPANIGTPAPFTFGCLVPINCLSLNTWRTWANILKQSPTTRLVLNLAGLGEAAQRHALAKLVGDEIDETRIYWADISNALDYCHLWQQIDLGLCPLTGDSRYITLLGAWVGVPSIASTNPLPGSQLTRAALSLLGLENFVTSSSQHYSELARELAANPEILQPYRAQLPQRLRNSAFANTANFALSFGQALQTLWQQAGGTVEATV